MRPTHVPEQFDRTMGCTAAELISLLPRSLPDAQLAVDATLGHCVASWPEGSLRLQWFPLPDRCIALLRIPQLQVHFAFQGLDDAALTHGKNSLICTLTEEAVKPWPFNWLFSMPTAHCSTCIPSVL